MLSSKVSEAKLIVCFRHVQVSSLNYRVSEAIKNMFFSFMRQLCDSLTAMNQRWTALINSIFRFCMDTFNPQEYPHYQ